METTTPLPDLFADDLFRLHFAAAIRRCGRGAVRVLKARHEYCPACGFQLPSQTLQAVLYHPDFCQHCGRMLLDECHELLPAFSALFNVSHTNKRIQQEELLAV